MSTSLFISTETNSTVSVSEMLLCDVTTSTSRDDDVTKPSRDTLSVAFEVTSVCDVTFTSCGCVLVTELDGR